jgi:beta-lactam-binding protein with PASTA domain
MSIFSKFRENSRESLLIHLGAVGIVGFLLLWAFFFLYLPSATNHGETMPVPDVRGQREAHASATLTEHRLRYEVIDSTYDADYPPLAVVAQHPRPGEEVKEQRKIYLTVNYAQPPSLRLPSNIINYSLKNAQEQLSILGLRVGEVSTVPYKFQAVVSVSVKGRRLRQSDLDRGFMVKTGTAVDLVVGDGEGDITSVEELEELLSAGPIMESE